ncbi:MAG: hypothetical protein CVU45_08700, partial [Chloroflexi bacterium HGW-Chloroflexi-7]
MTQADLILKNAIVLTMDLDFSQYDPGAIAILGNSILAVGDEKEILAKYTSEKIIDCNGKV